MIEPKLIHDIHRREQWVSSESGLVSQKVFYGDLAVVLVAFDQIVEKRVIKDSSRTENGVLDAERIHVLKNHDACCRKELGH